MKISFVTALLLPSVAAFAPHLGAPAPRTVTSLSVMADASEAIQAAMEATKKFGATSPEARVLWDNVEEMRFNNSPATKGGLDSECELDDDGGMAAACSEYDEKMEELSTLMTAYDDKLAKMKELTKDLKDIKGKVQTAAPVKASKSPELQTALFKATEEAKKASAEFGPTSTEAKLAWETVEEVASSGLGNAMGGRLGDDCLVDQASETFESLEELSKALKLDS